MAHKGAANGSLAAWVGRVLCLTVLLAGCATKVPSGDELTDTFVSTGLSEAEARCVSDAVLKTLPDDDIVRLMERGVGAAPRDDPNRDDDSYDRFRTALTACQEAAKATTATTPSGG